jgi:hypothetical protein
MTGKHTTVNSVDNYANAPVTIHMVVYITQVVQHIAKTMPALAIAMIHNVMLLFHPSLLQVGY